MKFLFLTDEFYPNFGANSLIVKTIGVNLVKKGNEVYVAPFNYSKDDKLVEVFQGIKILRKIPYDSKENAIKALKKFKILTFFKLTANIIKQKLLGPDCLKHKQRILARDILKEIINEKEIDVVVSINCSVEVGFPILYLKKHKKISAKWIFYMLDPFESHEYYRKHNKLTYLRKVQHSIMKTCDKVLATELIYNDTKKWENEDILSKIEITEFPKIEEPIRISTDNDILLDKSFINVVCTGSKNELVRNSEYTLKLCEQLGNKSVKFHFIGYGWCDKKTEKDNMTFYPPTNWQTVRNMQLDADFLLNIGNSISNQLPSKVLEYISCGKPVINIYKSALCPTLNLLMEYDALNIYENEEIEISLKQLEDFLNKKHIKIDFPEIENKYKRYTPEFVTNQFLNF